MRLRKMSKKYADIHFTKDDIQRLEDGDELYFSIYNVVCKVKKVE